MIYGVKYGSTYGASYGQLGVPTGTAIFGEAGVGAASKGAVWTPDTSKIVQPDGVGGFDVSAWDDESGTKTLDGTAAPPALSIGALDGHDGVTTDGVSEYMVVNMSWEVGDRPSMLAIASQISGFGLCLFDGYVYLLENWRTRAGLSGGSVAVDYPGAQNADYHLFEAHCDAAGYTGVYDGVASAGTETGGIATANGSLILGAARSDGSFPGQLTVLEVVLADAPSAATRTAYRDERITPYYPTVGANL